MSKVLITRSKLDNLANTISTKSGVALPLTIAQMDTAVQNMSGGGVTVESLNVTANGTYTAQSGKAYSPVTVAVPSGSDTSQDTVDAAHLYSGYTAHDSTGTQIVGSYTPPTFTTQTKSATPTESAQTIEPDSGYDGLSSVSVGAISSTYVGSGITRRSSTDLTASGDTVTAPAGYYASAASKSVASGTAGTPTATKSSVSNHSVSITPSVTNQTGYITGSTKTGTAVTVSASELVSGSETKTENGTFDVTNLAELVVNVSGTSVKTATGTFTGNGTRTIDVSCTFEPDIVYVNSDPGTTASSGTVAFIIVRGMMTGTRYRNNSTTNSHYAIPGIANMNSSGSSYSWRATYSTSTGKVTLYCFSNNARALLTSNRTYSYTFVKYTT